jgi:Flp pilus assembly protein TadD
MALLRMGKFSEAEESVRSALLVRPQGKDYHLGMGMVLKAEGKLPEAKQEIAVELAEDPQNAQAKTLLDEVSGEMQAQAEKPATGKPTKRDTSLVK